LFSTVEEIKMAYSEVIENRVKNIVLRWENTDSKKMFGGICHLMNGNMFCGVYKDFLILRLGEENAEKALRLVMVKEDGFKEEKELKSWLNQAEAFVRTLPAK
jgi:TfoX/Sxy family transcriptional regulator of competence genes